MKKEIDLTDRVLSLFLWPIGFAGLLFKGAFKLLGTRQERRGAAISASIAAIAIGIFILTVSGFYYASLNELLSESIITIAVRVILVLLIIGVLIGLIVGVSRK